MNTARQAVRAGLLSFTAYRVRSEIAILPKVSWLRNEILGGLLRQALYSGANRMIAANNSWCLAYDDLSHVPPWLSDALCRLSTGGGFATREL